MESWVHFDYAVSAFPNVVFSSNIDLDNSSSNSSSENEQDYRGAVLPYTFEPNANPLRNENDDESNNILLRDAGRHEKDPAEWYISL